MVKEGYSDRITDRIGDGSGGAAVMEMPEVPEASGASAKEMPEAIAPADADEEEAVRIDVELDHNFEWEVETEPAPGSEYEYRTEDEYRPEPGYEDDRGYDPETEPAYGTYERRDFYRRGAVRFCNKHVFTWVCSYLFGIFGVDRFMRGQTVLGVLKLGTFGGLGFWYLADLIIAIVKSYGGGYRNMEDLLFDEKGRYIY